MLMCIYNFLPIKQKKLLEMLSIIEQMKKGKLKLDIFIYKKG